MKNIIKLIFVISLFLITLINYQEKFNPIKSFGFHLIKDNQYSFSKNALVLYKNKNSLVNGQFVVFNNDNVKTISKIVETKNQSILNEISVKSENGDVIVDKKDILGTYICTIPKIGELLSIVRKPWGLFILILLPVLGIVITEIDELVINIKKNINMIMPFVGYKYFRFKSRFRKSSKFKQIELDI